MTSRLYHLDAYLREFEATVTALRGPDATAPAVALDATAFYPNAGGQPCDWGQIGGRRVQDVREENGEIWHVLESPDAPAVGSRVAGAIDWDRRFDHMQQHTGQHILSQAFLRTLGAQTLAVHMGTTSTIDVGSTSVDAGALARAEDLANAIVIEHRPVTIREVEAEQVEALGVRRPPKQTGRIRVVEVADFDRSACGGTHVRATGEVGAIVIRSWEHYKGGVRVEFLCGLRVVRDYRWTRGLLRDVTGQLTVGERELSETIARLRERTRELDRALADARSQLLQAEAAALVAAAAAAGGPPVVAAAFAGRSVEDLRALARAATVRADCLAIFAADPDRRIVVARSPALAVDASVILREALAGFNGRGGGKPEVAEGAAADAPSAEALVEAARAVAVRHLAALR
ncbi:MAG: alanyl-tRNA editing protein [Armatimonadetes bacterium]|nr:alanyl-tRNA editing protein [Armatimonadota bacterium]